MEYVMNQKYVLITGASRGIGRACALAFARNHFHVFLNCRHSLDALQQVEKEILDEHGSCTLLPGNAGNPDDVRKMFAIIESICRAGCAGQQRRDFLCRPFAGYE